MVQRLTYRRRLSYNTKSNAVRVVKAPSKLVLQYRKKLASGPKCGDAGCDVILPGIKHLRPKEYSRISKRQKRVSRAYGGSVCATCVKERVLRAFLMEEKKVVKKTLKEQAEEKAAAEKKDNKKPKKKKSKKSKK